MNNKKIWILRSSIGLLMTLCVAFAITTAFLNQTVFYVEAGILVLAVLLVLLRLRRVKADLHEFMQNIGSTLSSAQSDALLKFPIPLFVVGNAGEVVWYNHLARELVLKGQEDMFGEKLQVLIPELDMTLVSRPGGQRVSSGGHYYTAFSVFAYGREDGGAYIIYLVDDTEVAKQALEYQETRPSVLSIVIDNYEELMQGAKESQKAQVLGEIEGLLEQFVLDANGLLKRMDRNRFTAIIEERYMVKILASRFEILDKVRSIVCEENLSPTLSIGVGRGAETLHEADRMAAQALEMALGRGGDQAALRTSNGFEFYGGVSKGIEKRNRVKTRIVAAALTDLIQNSENVIVMGHHFADLDCLGAAIGLTKAIRQMGRECVIALNAATNLASPLYDRYVQEGESDLFLEPPMAIERVMRRTLLIVVDTHLPYFVESQELFKLCKTVAVIDHHRKMVGHIDNAVIFYHEPYASSASEMVSELLQYFDGHIRVSRMDAEALLSGIMLDTRNFAMRTGVRTFEAAAYLRRLGADTVEVKKLFSNSMGAYQKKMQIVSSARVYQNCAIAESQLCDDIKVVAPQAADELLGITGVDASFVMYEYDGGVSFSARSLGNVNVQLIMEKLGGGGHFTMAGAQLENTDLEHAEMLLRQAIREYNEEKTAK